MEASRWGSRALRVVWGAPVSEELLVDGHLGASRVRPSLKKLLETSWDHLSRDRLGISAQQRHKLTEESPAGVAG